jgi:MraZ protein
VSQNGTKWGKVGKINLVLHPLKQRITLADFIGEFDCKMDSKGRLALPSKLRMQIPTGMENTLVINRGFERCLVLYVLEDWKKETEKLSVLNEFNREARQFIRQYNNGATLLSVDGSARILLPKKLIQYAQLNDDVVINAYGNKIEIWSQENYENEMDFDADAFGKVAERLLGNPTPGEGKKDV